MKKTLIICAAGMSSSVMAQKTTEYFKLKDINILVDATTATQGNKAIETSDFDLFIISPQTKMYFKQFSEAGQRVSKPVVQIPFPAYIPIPMGIQKMAKLILDNMPDE